MKKLGDVYLINPKTQTEATELRNQVWKWSGGTER